MKPDPYREALEDLELMHAAGRVSPAQYEIHKARLLAEAAATPRRQRFDWKAWAIVGGVVACIALIGVLTSPRSNPTGPTTSTNRTTTYVPPSAPQNVTYDVTGTAESMSITYSTPAGTSQQADLSVPLTMKESGATGLTVSGFGSGDFLYISAQNGGEYGSLTCRILVDGKVIVTNTASGGYSIVTCSTSL